MTKASPVGYGIIRNPVCCQHLAPSLATRCPPASTERRRLSLCDRRQSGQQPVSLTPYQPPSWQATYWYREQHCPSLVPRPINCVLTRGVCSPTSTPMWQTIAGQKLVVLVGGKHRTTRKTQRNIWGCKSSAHTWRHGRGSPCWAVPSDSSTKAGNPNPLQAPELVPQFDPILIIVRTTTTWNHPAAAEGSWKKKSKMNYRHCRRCLPGICLLGIKDWHWLSPAGMGKSHLTVRVIYCSFNKRSEELFRVLFLPKRMEGGSNSVLLHAIPILVDVFCLDRWQALVKCFLWDHTDGKNNFDRKTVN